MEKLQNIAIKSDLHWELKRRAHESRMQLKDYVDQILREKLGLKNGVAKATT